VATVVAKGMQRRKSDSAKWSTKENERNAELQAEVASGP
jgi:hypothetical protein